MNSDERGAAVIERMIKSQMKFFWHFYDNFTKNPILLKTQNEYKKLNVDLNQVTGTGSVVIIWSNNIQKYPNNLHKIPCRKKWKLYK